jgi:hypothetical protein
VGEAHPIVSVLYCANLSHPFQLCVISYAATHDFSYSSVTQSLTRYFLSYRLVFNESLLLGIDALGRDYL